MKIKTIAIGIVFGLCTPLSAAITTESLLDEMTDLERLTRFPEPAYTNKQFSSYHRASKTPTDPVGWFANGDRGQYLREEQRDGRTEYVMMDAAGPGAVVRFWSADPKGTLRMYLDNSETPALEADMKALMSGDVPGFSKPLAGEAGKGFNLYFPFPYSKHCKVTCDQGKTYYHVNYRTYQSDAAVISFARDDLTRLADKMKHVAEHLADSRSRGVKPEEFALILMPGQQSELLHLTGPKAIDYLYIVVRANDSSAAARGTVLSMTFDGEQTVESPIGDFFGTAPGFNCYESLPIRIVKGIQQPLLVSKWWMPFHKNASIRVRNLSDQRLDLEGGIMSKAYKWDDRSLLFHAKWRIQRDIPVKPSTDWTHLACEGKGRFVGGELHIVNPVRRWWGEGDEKVYVDGESFPSTFGTGSEDYYGYAWCSPELFTRPYHNQTRCDGPGNYGNTSVNRFHIIDDIPFTTQFKFDMENLHQTGYKNLGDITTTRDAVSYWYARPGGKDFFKPITKEDVKPVEVPPMQPDRPQANADKKIVPPPKK